MGLAATCTQSRAATAPRALPMARRPGESKGVTAIRIDGATRLYAIVGDPIAQVRSPEVFTELFADAGMNAVMIPMHVLLERFEDSMRALMGSRNLDGLLATVPYKAQAVPFANRARTDGESHRRCERAAPRAGRHVDWRHVRRSRIRARRRAQGRRCRQDAGSRCSARVGQAAQSAASSRRPVSSRCRSSIHKGSAQRRSLRRFAVRF